MESLGEYAMTLGDPVDEDILTGLRDTLHLRHITDDLGLTDTQRPTRIWNDNQGAVDWSAGFSNRKMRHLNMRENLVRENADEAEE